MNRIFHLPVKAKNSDSQSKQPVYLTGTGKGERFHLQNMRIFVEDELFYTILI